MEADAERPRPVEISRGCYRLNIILNVLIGLFLGVCIVLILNMFNRSGWFALLSGLFGAMIYCALALPRILFGPIPGMHRGNAVAHGREMSLRARVRGLYRGVVLLTLIGIALLVALYYLPGQQPIFAFISAVIVLLLCVCLFMIGLSALALFIARRE